ncbi:PTS galactitol transporter subunit IIB [Aerococcaceae bacterium DSM 109653]|uniref:PTS galactitol transporter subunit IIB n=1 Tax=Fundicoccus ignavus TaxID=2664442 RepID=A0A844BKZ1_9LACT|nr:PTS sugar transporter subunit IIB [Fundicoccus ignavus]MRI82615.1 PTS galactitol transporter subunit IIB [Fundicoccus ignavus]
MKKILVACGAGIATSTVVNQHIQQLLKEHGIQADLEQIRIAEAKSKQHGADLLISTTILPTTYDIPAIVATSYITGIGKAATDQKVLDALKD